MVRRKIIEIDQVKCNGCGLCVPACAEGALKIIDGKARLVSEVYCDGLGACLGECPQGAINIIERDAEAFDEQAVEQHLAAEPSKTDQPTGPGCPGARAQDLSLNVISSQESSAKERPADTGAAPLGNWPVQLHLVPPNAPFLCGADLLLVADCVPLAFADFHRKLVRDRPVVIGCPKLDDRDRYVEKLTEMITMAIPRSISVVRMEVPCCMGLLRIAASARERAGSSVPIEEIVITVRGQMIAPKE